MELLTEAWALNGKKLTKNTPAYKDIETVYYSIGRKKGMMTFAQFLEILPTLSIYLSPEEHNREDAVRKLLHTLIKIYKAEFQEQIEGSVV